jgi:organic hydroperoxide reductase OsmC/OhrA
VQTVAVEPVVHRYRAVVSWQGSTAVGYDRYERHHLVGGVPPLNGALSGDPAFGGDVGLPNPEQLVLVAAASCQLLSFLAVAARARVDVVAYEDRVEALMPEDDRPMRLTEVRLHPVVHVRGDVTDDRLRHLVEVAHRECFIANSLRSEITVTPTFVREGEAAVTPTR